MTQNLDPNEIFKDPRYSDDSEELKNVFRYLAKILACHIADIDGPRFVDITEFAIGRSDINPIRLYIDRDPVFEFWFQETKSKKFLQHGGLTIETSRSTRLILGFYSTLTYGPVRYVFSVEPYAIVTHTIKALYPKFYERLMAAHDEEIRLNNSESSISNHEENQILK